MANLKAIRQRIRSVQNTQKINRAMRLVAAAKVRRAQMRTLAGRPFTQRIVRLLRQVCEEVADIDLQGLPLLERREVKKVCLIVFSSDRGLCGSYNTNVVKRTARRIEELRSEGKEVGLITIGLKAAAFFKRVKVEKFKTFTLMSAIPSIQEAKLVSEVACELYKSKQIDSVEIIATRFVNMIRQDVEDLQYLPVELPEGYDHHPLSSETLFEPDLMELMEAELLPKYVENTIYQAFLESTASELAARMNAMTNASNNARELIQALTLEYNKARQASITQELLEIVGGAEALAK